MTSKPNTFNPMTLSHIKLRRLIGLLGGVLPFLLLGGNYLISKLNVLTNDNFIMYCSAQKYSSMEAYKRSISHYYYTPMGEIFTGILIAVAIFLFCYKGHPLRKGEVQISDKILTDIAAIGALGVVIFPAGNDGECIIDNFRIFVSTKFIGYIHLTFALTFFVSLALMSIYNFRRTDKVEDFGKGKYHDLYRICGFGILGSLLFIFIYILWIEDLSPQLDNMHPIFIFETLALFFFSYAWLVKGKVDLAGQIKSFKKNINKSDSQKSKNIK